MGIKYELPESHADMPTEVDGIMHSQLLDQCCEAIRDIVLAVRFWDGEDELSRQLVTISKARVLRNGGDEAAWETVCAFAPKDTNDLIQYMIANEWSSQLLWSAWYGYIGQ